MSYNFSESAENMHAAAADAADRAEVMAEIAREVRFAMEAEAFLADTRTAAEIASDARDDEESDAAEAFLYDER